MRLQRVNQTLGFYFTCIKCAFHGLSYKVKEVWADLDGEPFKAYYCEICVKEVLSNDGDTNDEGKVTPL